MSKKLDIIINSIKGGLKDDLPSLSSEMAFNFTLALFPFLIILVAIFGLFSNADVINKIVFFLKPIAPSDALNLLQNVLMQEINKSASRKMLTVGSIGALWAVTGATDTIIKALNRAYKVKETRPIWVTKGAAIFLVMANVVVLFAAINLILFTSSVLKFFANYVYINHFIQNLILVSRWPIAFLSLFAIILIVYSFMPNIKENNKVKVLSTIPGALFFCIFWTFGSWLFAMYVENFGNYSKIYGTLAAVIIFLVWLYYTSFLLLLGGELNARIYRRYFVSKFV